MNFEFLELIAPYGRRPRLSAQKTRCEQAGDQVGSTLGLGDETAIDVVDDHEVTLLAPGVPEMELVADPELTARPTMAAKAT